MKRIVAVWGILFLLSGCNGGDGEMERAMELRSRVLKARECSFEAEITADYGDKLHHFTLACHADSEGDLSFTVVSPESISGIKGMICDESSNFHFEETSLVFPLLAEGQLSPISAPWIFLKTLRSGFLTAVGTDDLGLRLTIDDSYEEDAMQLDIWLNEQDVPQRAEILYDGKRILSLDVKVFSVV